MVHIFKKSATSQVHHNWLLIDCGRLIDLKNLHLRPSLINHVKYFLKMISLVISISWPGFMSKLSKILKNRYLKTCFASFDIIHQTSQLDGIMELVRALTSFHFNVFFKKV